MQMKTRKAGGVLTASLSGELDHHNAAEVREKLDRLVAQDVKTLELDLGGVTFMDSSGIGVVLGRYKLMQERGGRLRVSGAERNRYVARILKMAGISALLQQKRA